MQIQTAQSNVLIVDDMYSNQLLLKKMLEPLKQNMVLASSAKEALRLCEKNHFDLFLLDISMPQIDGFELANLLRNKAVHKETQIIFVTGIQKTREHVLQGLEIGAVDFIIKPVDREVLFYKVRTCLKIAQQAQQLMQKNIALEREITVRKQIEQELLLSSSAFNEGAAAILITGKDLKIIRVNPAFTEVTGYEQYEVIGLTPKILASGQHDCDFYKQMWDAIKSEGRWTGEIWNKRKDGIVYPQIETITAVKQQGKLHHYIATFSDISNIKAHEAIIDYLKYYDDLTKLPNKSLFKTQVKQSIAQMKRNNRAGALLYIGINDFRKFNDTLGHVFGDLILKEFSTKLRIAVRQDAIVARFGGDEFVIWIDDINPSKDDAIHVISKVLQRISRLFAEPLRIDSMNVLITYSTGISLFPYDDITITSLLRKADTAMYRVKSKGHNRYEFFQAKMEQVVRRKLAIETELRLAISQHSLELYYQPQVDIDSRKIKGCEALLRWTHEQMGYISPADFVPIAESSNLIFDLGLWVLENACQQIKLWEEQGLFESIQTVSVNVSAKQFMMTDFIQNLADVLGQSQIMPCHLDIELTETALVDDFDMVCTRLNDIKALGCQISIDDFGTGYSSLQYLKRFPVDILKIDKCFIDDIQKDKASRAIVSTIISLADMLGANVIAEGVEDQEQADYLALVQCHTYQGFLCSPAVPAQKFSELLLAGEEVVN